MRFLILLMILIMASDGARKANDAYEKGDFAGAEQAYLEAIRENPDDARLHFNLGNALAKQGKFDEAISAYERFKNMTSDPQSKALADFNIGNIYGNQEKWERATQQFRNALRQNPGDEDAKYNYELSNRIQQEQEENPQQQQQDNDQQQDGDDGEQQNQSQPQEGDEHQQNEQQQNPEQDQNDSQGSPQQQPQPQSEMTQEEADRILNALENKEKDLLKDFHKNKVPSNTRHAKNW